MARILQDGFETEGKEIASKWEYGREINKLDVATFISDLASNNSGNAHTSGVCASRGGYGEKAFSLKHDIAYNKYYSICALKYDLTANCNNTNELFYRVWVNPHSNRLLPMAITDYDFDKKVDSISSGSHFQNVLNMCNCALVTENIDGQTYLLNCYCKGDLVYSFNHLFYNQWVKLDVRLKVGDVDNGIFQLRINDKLITTFNGHTGTANPKYLFIGLPSVLGESKFSCAVDDVAVNDTTGNVNNSWCGNGSIIGIVPTANGSKTMFTPGIDGTQNYENVDDVIPDGDVTYNSSYVLNDVDLFKFTIPEEMEIPPTETINAISVTTRAKFVEQPTNIGHIVSDGANETLIKQHELSNDYTANSSIVEEKSDGTKYKVSDIANLEFGYKTLESTKAQEE